MNVNLLIGTFGSDDWRDRGEETARRHVLIGAANVRYHHMPDGTLAQTRNAAASHVSHASGEWLCFLDADDSLAPGYFDAMSAAAPAEVAVSSPVGSAELVARASGAAALLVPAVQYVKDGGERLGHPVIPSWLGNLYEVNCAVIGTLVPADLFRRVGGFRDHLDDGTPLYSLEDWDLWLRCVEAGAVMYPVEDAVYLARAGHRRNADQSPWAAIRAERVGYPWGDVRRYKYGYPDMVGANEPDLHGWTS